MLCPKCSNYNPADASFCEGCGAKLELLCPTCKAPASPGSLFCKKCGTAIGPAKAAASTTVSSTKSQIIVATDGAASEAIDGARKTVTALYAVLTSTTKLMEELDPERSLRDPALQLMIDAVHQYDGYVVHTFGDDFIALFGAPVAHEDHPQRAVHAALAARDDLGRRGEELRLRGRAGLELRIRIHTGEVVMRSVLTGGHTEYFLIGHAINVVMRMRGVALADAIVVSAETRRLVEGYFELRGLGLTELKGIAEPIEMFEVVAAGPLTNM
jgi:class 3 adenylate cyclase